MPSRSVRLSSPERVLFPDDGITKSDLFEYYRAIAPVLVPHLRNRPFTMKRYPLRQHRRRVFPEAGTEGDALLDPHAPVRHPPARG